MQFIFKIKFLLMWDTDNRNNRKRCIDWEVVDSLIRHEGYLDDTYDVKETVNFSENYMKFFAETRDKEMNVVITRAEIFRREDILERLCMMIKLIEDNIILVENVWIYVEDLEHSDQSKIF
jgi:hypothetical protein